MDTTEANTPILPGLQDLEIAHMEAVRALRNLKRAVSAEMDKAEQGGNRAADLIALYRRVYNADEEMTEEMKGLGAQKERFKFKLLPEAYEREKITTLTTTEKDRVSLSTTTRASIPADRRGVVYDWLRETNNGAIIQETVNASTLSAFVAAELEQNRPVHDDITVSVATSASLTRGTKPQIKKGKSV